MNRKPFKNNDIIPLNPPTAHNEVRLKRGAFHPPLSTGRLEGEYHQDLTKWAPSIKYNLTLEQVRNQMTPAEL